MQRDPEFFFQTAWHIKVPGRGIVPFEVRPAQRRALKRWSKDRYSLTLKARQIGWSTLVAAYQFWLAFFHEGETIIDISRTEREAIKLLEKTKLGYRRLPEWVKERGPKSLVDHQQKMAFDNDSSIVSMPSASDPARGESATLIVVDEWAYLPNPEDAWASIEPVADIGGRIIGLSTANGSGNFFHQLWVGAETGNNKFKTMFEPWSAVTERSQEWYEQQKRALPPWQLAQEYPSTPEEAFIKSGRTIFDIDMLKERVEPKLVEPDRGYLSELNSLSVCQWKPNYTDPELADDPLAIWDLPSPRGAYVIGADVAEGLDHGDYSSAHVIQLTPDLEPWRVVAHWHGHTDPDLFGVELFKLGMFYNCALVGVERNNHGLATINKLRDLGYKKLFLTRDLGKIGEGTPSDRYGWQTTTKTKPYLIDQLNEAIRDGDLEIPDSDTYGELKTFVRDERGRLTGSPYDDRVVSLGIARQMLKYANLPHYAEDHDMTGTLSWWVEYANNQQAPPARDIVIGSRNRGRHRR